MNDHGIAWLAHFALQSAEFIDQRKERIAEFDLTDAEVAGIRDLVDDHHDALTRIEELLPDIDLIAAHDRANGELTDDEYGAIDAEMKRRRLFGKPLVSWSKDHDDRVKAMANDELLAAYRETTRERGELDADTLLAKIERRNLDIL